MPKLVDYSPEPGLEALSDYWDDALDGKSPDSAAKLESGVAQVRSPLQRGLESIRQKIAAGQAEPWVAEVETVKTPDLRTPLRSGITRIRERMVKEEQGEEQTN